MCSRKIVNRFGEIVNYRQNLWFFIEIVINVFCRTHFCERILNNTSIWLSALSQLMYISISGHIYHRTSRSYVLFCVKRVVCAMCAVPTQVCTHTHIHERASECSRPAIAVRLCVWLCKIVDRLSSEVAAVDENAASFSLGRTVNHCAGISVLMKRSSSSIGQFLAHSLVQTHTQFLFSVAYKTWFGPSHHNSSVFLLSWSVDLGSDVVADVTAVVAVGVSTATSVRKEKKKNEKRKINRAKVCKYGQTNSVAII